MTPGVGEGANIVPEAVIWKGSSKIVIFISRLCYSYDGLEIKAEWYLFYHNYNNTDCTVLIYLKYELCL